MNTLVSIPYKTGRRFSRTGRTTAILLFLLLFFTPKLYAAQAAPPIVDREAAEESFLKAYEFFLENRLWNTLDNLDQAIKHNTYFVDTYYLRSLALRRLGRYPDAIKAMSDYMEVRRTDHRGRIILGSMEEEWEIIRRTLYPLEIATELFFRNDSINSFLNVPAYNPLSFKGMQGMGKLGASGHYLFVNDTLGNRLWVFGRLEKPLIMQLQADAPVAVLPLSPYEALLLLRDGEIKRLTIDSTAGHVAMAHEGRISANVSDAALIDSTFMSVADRTGGAVRFYGLPSMGETAEWRPDDSGTTEKMFEPVALASYGPYLAVADRGNGRIFVLDIYTLSVLDSFAVEAPRDVEWGNQGELYILSENGSLYSRFPIGPKAKGLKSVSNGMANAWSMVWTNRGPVIADVSGRSWWSSKMNPGHLDTIGIVSLHHPWIEGKEGEETLFLRGAASSIFHDFIQHNMPDLQAVWRNEVRPSRIMEVASGNTGHSLFYSPSSIGIAGAKGDVRRASSFSDVLSDIAKVSRSGEEMPKVIVLDTRISATEEELAQLLSFLLQQGIRLDLWAIGRPASALQTHISRITLGYTYYARTLETVPFNESIEWILSVPLPPDVATFGYPSEATLSIFATIDVIRFTDWIPIWPTMIKRK